ncbi:hypothetical protein [Actinomadura macrotermitis]|uniref:hypothetical protein n=1 Tax=Actinomadura macrotermitis TaxID=2585200 RepID=UPI0012963BE2|nr:hypothetical protein [Actinomadura macrotermitis]
MSGQPRGDAGVLGYLLGNAGWEARQVGHELVLQVPGGQLRITMVTPHGNLSWWSWLLPDGSVIPICPTNFYDHATTLIVRTLRKHVAAAYGATPPAHELSGRA